MHGPYYRSLRVVKLVIRLHNASGKVVEFMMELHHGSLKGNKASFKASS